MEIALRIVLMILLVYTGICVVYFLFQEKFIFVPTLPGEPFEIKLALHTEEFQLKAPHNGSIHCLLVKAENTKGLVFYLHGNTGSLKRWQFMAEEIAGYGFDVFVMDYRGYGKSQGIRSEARMHRDVEFCYDWIAEKYTQKPRIIYGRSLGSGFATRLASRRHSDGLVLETPFLNLVDVAKSYAPILPVDMLLRYKMRSDIFIQRVDCPIHIFHGTKDSIVRYSSAFELFS
ncbi:MAG: alpha/beta hydrolase [Flavobacteriales bacterium]